MDHRVAHLDTRWPTVEQDASNLQLQGRDDSRGLRVVGFGQLQRSGQLAFQLG
ncbi:hypothetical protein D3C74_463030 [compost metagenome]